MEEEKKCLKYENKWILEVGSIEGVKLASDGSNEVFLGCGGSVMSKRDGKCECEGVSFIVVDCFPYERFLRGILIEVFCDDTS